MARLTEAAVRNLKPGSIRREVPDGLVGGLYAVVQPTGRVTFAVRYRRPQGGHAKLTLGQHGIISLATARDLARDALIKVKRGEDPAFDKHARVDLEANTVAAVAGAFVERYCRPKNKCWRETDRLLRKHVVPRWGQRKLTDIRRTDVHALLDGIVDAGTPMVANRVFAALRKMWNWAIER